MTAALCAPAAGHVELVLELDPDDAQIGRMSA